MHIGLRSLLRKAANLASAFAEVLKDNIEEQLPLTTGFAFPLPPHCCLSYLNNSVSVGGWVWTPASVSLCLSLSFSFQAAHSKSHEWHS